MSSKKNQKEFWKDIKKFNVESYLDGISLAKLAIVAIYKLQEAGEESSFNNIAVALYRMFPEKFKLISFPEHPDFMRIDNTLRLDCNHSGFITGKSSRAKLYTLTPYGKMIAEETLQILQNEGSVIKSENSTNQSMREKYRNRETRLINEVSKSPAYQKFVKGEGNTITKFETVDFLHGTLDTKSKILEENLQTLLRHAKHLNEFEQYRKIASSVIEFLKYIEKRGI